MSKVTEKQFKKYLEFMTDLSDNNREELYSPKGSFTTEQIKQKLVEPRRNYDKGSYREIEISNKYAPQHVIRHVTSVEEIITGSGIKVKVVRNKAK